VRWEAPDDCLDARFAEPQQNELGRLAWLHADAWHAVTRFPRVGMAAFQHADEDDGMPHR